MVRKREGERVESGKADRVEFGKEERVESGKEDRVFYTANEEMDSIFNFNAGGAYFLFSMNIHISAFFKSLD